MPGSILAVIGTVVNSKLNKFIKLVNIYMKKIITVKRKQNRDRIKSDVGLYR